MIQKAVLSALAAGLVGTSCGAQQLVLNAHPPPPDTGLTTPCGLFFDLEALLSPVVVEGLTTGVDVPAGGHFRIDLFIHDGTALGGDAYSGPGSSMEGWTSLGTVFGTQGPTSEGVCLPIAVPRFVLQPGHVVGVALSFNTADSPMYAGGSEPYSIYQDSSLRITTGDVRFDPFYIGGPFFSPRALVGSIIYELDPCYSNCDGSTAAPVLNVNDFVCFLGKFANGDSYANCDGSTTPPILNVNDFLCFTQQFAAGCS